MTFRTFLAVFLLVGLAACSQQTRTTVRDDEKQSQQQTLKPIAETQTRVAPGKCRFVGTVIAIDSSLEKGGPCSKVPCQAVVSVDSIVGYGMAFGNPLALNEKISVRFTFTLSRTTEDLFPNMTERLPGLEVGSKFQSDLESTNTMNAGTNRVPYLVYLYTKLK